MKLRATLLAICVLAASAKSETAKGIRRSLLDAKDLSLREERKDAHAKAAAELINVALEKNWTAVPFEEEYESAELELAEKDLSLHKERQDAHAKATAELIKVALEKNSTVLFEEESAELAEVLKDPRAIVRLAHAYLSRYTL